MSSSQIPKLPLIVEFAAEFLSAENQPKKVQLVKFVAEFYLLKICRKMWILEQ